MDTLLHYYELPNDLPPLVLIHAQGVYALSYDNVMGNLSDKFHVYAIDCYGHGASLHKKEQYNIKAIGDAVISFIENHIGDKVQLVGHSSGGLIAAYIAAYSDVCVKLYLEDPPFFSCQGERRYHAFNYLDLSTVCHHYIEEKSAEDFILYYFRNQKMWDFFPEKSREKFKRKMVRMAEKNRKKYPDRDLKLLFWPKAALEGYRGMKDYDPYFGEAFYSDSFHAGIAHEEMLAKIECKTIIMKAKTKFSEDNILLAAMSEEDVQRVNQLIKNSEIVRFDCGHGVHMEKPMEFLRCFL